jgi:hypothetical protein
MRTLDAPIDAAMYRTWCLRGYRAPTEEMLVLIEEKELQDSGCGAVDLGLLACTLLTLNAALWSVDQNLENLAAHFEVAFGAVN